MACNLTYGLPQVFERHPVINLRGVVHAIEGRLKSIWKVVGWETGSTQVVDPRVNIIPVFIRLERTG